MNSLERAKRFVAEKASRLALTVVPLAALAVSAVPAKAATLNPSTCTAFATSGSASCSTIQVNPVGQNPQLNWIAFGGSGSAPFGGSINFGISGGTADGGSISAGTVPVSWDFFIDPVMVTLKPGPLVTSVEVSWSVFFNLNLDNTSFPSFSMSGSAPLGSEVTGSGLISVSGGSVNGYTMSLSTSSSLSYSVSVPLLTSVDLNPGTPAGVPEPSTLLLMIPGLAGALILRRRKKTA
jgi:PEP-CTERM motif